ncbi:hypothetical protein LOTGIDRAFT_182505 [Lottia gigantea]|uniref:Translocation protein SEC62 n=1 Tax=Lottia gigantea TaxID=225164 RepID=V4BQN4_LOTGI|nr:hypothetical protein LOTGIDRAFT_182505 [Lottia gigantea]ESO91209.1 hypothetical protein LOTGIDRAFT_182505 [Lottia gigantea]
MADRKRKRKGEEEAVVPTKEEYAVAKFLRFNVPVREGKLVGMPVKCFIASKAVDALLESKWSASKAKKDPLFTTRKSCEGYCHNLLLKGLFHRAEKVERKKDRDKSKKKKKDIEEESVDESKKSKKGKKDTDTEKDKIEEVDKKDDDKKEEKKEEKKDEEKKKKEKKVKLNMHDDQKFVDADDQFYVWIYDPVPFKTFLIGLLMVFGAIALCMFPLWPEFVRVGVYYISLAAAGFVGLILGLAVVRLILFCIIWCVTFGKHHFWFLPNLTEDVGIIESFQPLYKHDVVVKDKKDDTKSRTKKDKTSKSSNNEDQTAEEGSDKSEQDEFEIVEKTDLDDEMQLDETDEPIGEDELTDEQIDETDEQNDSEQVEEDSETKKDKYN